MKNPSRRAFTLAELVLVLVVLIAVAALLIPLLSEFSISTPSGEKTEKQVATETTMRSIRDAAMGTQSKPGAWPDLGQRPNLFPRNPDYLLLEYVNITAISEYSTLSEFNPATKTGWRGPYLTGVTNLIDAWGNDILIQVDFDENGTVDANEARYARLVSAGPDEVYDTSLSDGYIPGDNNPAGTEINLAECNDDIVLFLRVPDTRQ